MGAYGGDDACPSDPECDSGAVYIFERDQGGPDNWGLVVKLTASDEAAGAFFGENLGLDGDTLVVGASGVGQAYVFERDSGGPNSWGEVAILSPSDPEEIFEFDPETEGLVSVGFGFGLGFNIGIDVDTIAVPNPLDSDDVNCSESFPDYCESGSVYIFERNLGGPDNWGQRTEIHAADPEDFDIFGIDVSLEGDTLAVGSLFGRRRLPLGYILQLWFGLYLRAGRGWS